MGILEWLRAAFRGSAKVESLSPPDAHFVYVKIPEPIGPIDRGSKYEDPIDDRLRNRGLGQITGGGSQFGDADSNGARPMDFCGIDVDLLALEEGLVVLREALIELGAPVGTELHYEDAGTKLRDEFLQNGWALRRPRTFLHPGVEV
jgi:hypothetical protein